MPLPWTYDFRYDADAELRPDELYVSALALDDGNTRVHCSILVGPQPVRERDRSGEHPIATCAVHVE